MAASAPPAAVAITSAGAAASSDWLASLTGQVDAADEPSSTDQGYTQYTVRGWDCLWDLAWNEFGEPELWPEIFEASRSVDQPDGHRLTDPDLILPGWVLHIPAPHETGSPARRHPQDSTRPPKPNDANEAYDRPEDDQVVTPFMGALASSDALGQWEPAPEHRGDHVRVVTPLRSPDAAASRRGSMLEARWLQSTTDTYYRTTAPRWRERLQQPPGS